MLGTPMSAIEIVAAVSFWICVGAIAYTYVGYPGVIWACAAAFGHRRPTPSAEAAALPRVSILIVGHNEEDSLADRLTNALALDYPADRFELVIASDGSTDRTAAIAASVRDSRLRVMDLPFRQGKAAVLNQVIPTLTSDIVVLSDANTAMEPAALRRMVRWFEDQRVGVVVGRLDLTDPSTGRNVDSLYWKYETFLKRMDARLGALLGANGAVYALRRSLFTPMPAETLVDDLVLPLLIRLSSGCDVVYDEAVIAHEETPSDLRAEFKRRRRIGAGGFQGLSVLWPLLSPARGWIAFTFLSHKVMRWVCPFLLIGALGTNALLVDRPVYLFALCVQVLFYLAAAAGAALPGSHPPLRLLRLTTMFASMHAALLAGFWQWAFGVRTGTWDRTARSARRTGAKALRALATESDAPIRVVHLVIALEIGGLEVVVANLARQVGRRFQLHVICLEGLGPIASKVQHSGVAVEVIGRPDTSILRSVLRLRRRLKALRPDVIHTHNEKAHIRGALASLVLFQAPALVHTRHGETRATGWAAFANRLAVWRSGFIVSVSEKASAISRAEGAPAWRTRIIRNGIDMSILPVAPREDASRSRVVAIGRLTPVKDFATMLRAARIVADADPAFHLDVIGDGPSRPALERLRHELRLQRHVTFHGASNNVMGVLSGARLFVQSSLSEGISLTLLEAMAGGVPIVATDVGGTPEVLEDGVTGMLVSPGDPAAFAAAMLRVLHDDRLAESMSTAARTRAERDFNVDKMTASYEALYEEAVLGRPGTQAA
jgi:glycosyltransferase involved in cell wall biosynthesis/cellulose synthase/poly-beta-1,6-N-acetylglucosamine synthase-like glycosyltransferase